jgi:O-succinylbenzoic acid--CoA ligase
MSRALRELPTTDPAEMLRALRDALTGDGPAVLPRERGRQCAAAQDAAAANPVPSEVGRSVALVIETSGSTGSPKRVALSTDALLASAAASASSLGGEGQWLLALPVHYIGGAQVLVRSIVAGTEPLALARGHFDARAFCELASAMTADARFVSLVPVQLARLMEAAAEDQRLLASLQRFDGILLGGQRPRPDLLETADELGLAVSVTYGSSETSGGCVYNGVPIGNTQVRVVDEQLEIAGSVLAEGYLGDPDRTAAIFHESDGFRWYRTGDLGSVEDGRIVVTGRADSVIISGGEKVSLDAVERAVREIEGYGDSVVVGIESEEWGQVPVVAVAGSPALALDAVRLHIAARLGRASAPARIVIFDAIPMLSSGKPDRVTIARTVSD